MKELTVPIDVGFGYLVDLIPDGYAEFLIFLFVFSYKNALTFAFGYTMIIEKQMSTDQGERKRQETISLSRRLS